VHSRACANAFQLKDSNLFAHAFACFFADQRLPVGVCVFGYLNFDIFIQFSNKQRSTMYAIKRIRTYHNRLLNKSTECYGSALVLMSRVKRLVHRKTRHKGILRSITFTPQVTHTHVHFMVQLTLLTAA